MGKPSPGFPGGTEAEGPLSGVERAFESLSTRAERLGVELGPDQVGALRRHFELVLSANRRLNLTRITDPREAVLKLYLISLSLFPALERHDFDLRDPTEYLDLGTGAGFPGIPVAVAAPRLRTTLIDARGKKAGFVTRAIGALGLDRVRALKARGADLTGVEPVSAGRYRLITARAVAPLATTIAEVKELAAPGALVVIYKGPGLGPEEVEGGKEAARRHGFALAGVEQLHVEGLTPKLVLFRAGPRFP